MCVYVELISLQTYLWICNCKVVGCAIVERIFEAYRLVIPTKTPQRNANENGLGDQLRCSNDKVPAALGISRIWVHSPHRRKRIASRLVDIARYF